MEEETSQSTSFSPRRTRQRAKLDKAAAEAAPCTSTQPRSHPALSTAGNASNETAGTRPLPTILTPNLKLKDLGRQGLQRLLQKRQRLAETPVAVPDDMRLRGLAPSLMATLVFAQEEAGTAVCISPDGLLLTCAHCLAETADAFNPSRSHWLLFASCQVVEARALAWDARRDLALLRIVASQPPPPSSTPSSTPSSSSRTTKSKTITTATPEEPPPAFPFITPSPNPPPLKARLVCVGHPGSEDLEAATPGASTGYDVLHLSTGTFRGLAGGGQDPQDNSEIGALMHTCWTYWGHSGAPLVDRRTGTLVGLHSSWDDETGMRRGVALEAIVEFLEENERFTK
ncbi:AT hook domain-containing protein [Colletotrichum tabaci]|uniref:AT hook domain-containing protein n=1 Tax=Colletotrichum tabaci TaxID=1209068 RepID=A0AAV9SUY5_9PEZI